MLPEPRRERRRHTRRADDIAPGDGGAVLAQQRLRLLYEIARQLAKFESVDRTIPAILAIAAQTLPLRSAVLIVESKGETHMTGWPEGLPADEPAWAHARTVYRQLTRRTAELGAFEESPAGQFILLPLAVDHRPLFGALQIEGFALDEADLAFVSGIVHQLGVALARHLSWQADLSERNRAQVGEEAQTRLAHDAEAANRAKDDFLAVLSHELRAPLNAILGWAELLSGGSLEPHETVTALATITRNAKAQNQLIDDLLDTQRIVSGKLHVEMLPVDLAAAITAARDSLRPAADAKGIDVSLSLGDGCPVSGDSDRLQQVFRNLLQNAIKFTPAGGHVGIALERGDVDVVVTVSDTGPGIPPDVLPYIFERFRQADSSSTRAHGGLGLGLAIVRSLVGLHGGTVTASNRSPETGALFKVTLPRLLRDTARDLPAEAVDPVRRAAAASSLAGIRIVLVDDSADDRDVLSLILTNDGAEVFPATSAAEGLAAVERGRPDLVVSDIGMPGEDGYAFLERLRALPRERGGLTPVIALTAYASEGHRKTALAAGFQAHVVKPVDATRLIAEASALVARARPAATPSAPPPDGRPRG